MRGNRQKLVWTADVVSSSSRRAADRGCGASARSRNGMDLLKRPNETGRAALEGVYVAHFLSNADQYGEGIVVVDDGRFMA